MNFKKFIHLINCINFMNIWICEEFKKTPAGIILRAKNIKGTRSVEVLIPNELVNRLKEEICHES